MRVRTHAVHPYSRSDELLHAAAADHRDGTREDVKGREGS